VSGDRVRPAILKQLTKILQLFNKALGGVYFLLAKSHNRSFVALLLRIVSGAIAPETK
jgi:hypothetical protein